MADFESPYDAGPVQGNLNSDEDEIFALIYVNHLDLDEDEVLADISGVEYEITPVTVPPLVVESESINTEEFYSPQYGGNVPVGTALRLNITGGSIDTADGEEKREYRINVKNVVTNLGKTLARTLLFTLYR